VSTYESIISVVTYRIKFIQMYNHCKNYFINNYKLAYYCNNYSRTYPVTECATYIRSSKSVLRYYSPERPLDCMDKIKILATNLELGFKLRSNWPVKSTTKDILALLQILFHIPSKRSMGLVESLFGICRKRFAA